VYEAVKFWYFRRYTVEHGISSECVEGISEIKFDDDVVVQQVFHVMPCGVYCGFCPSCDCYAKLNRSKVVIELQQYIMIGAFGCKASPYVADRDWTDASRFLQQGY
jgi:hypothetical protein